MNSGLVLYFIKPPEKDRFFKGDAKIRQIIRRIVKGKPRPGGVEKVFINLCKGLDIIKQPYIVNLPFTLLKPDDRVAILGAGKHCLDGYVASNKIVAGIGLMTHPSEWPNLCTTYPVVKYLQHSEWANNVYKPYFGDKCAIWPVGIETDQWKPNENVIKKYDVLVYNKIRWDKQKINYELREPILKTLYEKSLKYTELVYGNYSPDEFKNKLLQSKSVIFLVEHESQGIACGEMLSTNVPIFAWDNGYCLDPNRFSWGQNEIPATSVPYFDDRCGMKFKDLAEFEARFSEFYKKVEKNKFAPREYILENLSLEKSASQFMKIINETYENITTS